MDSSQQDIRHDSFEELLKLPPHILEEKANEVLRAQDEQRDREVLLPRSWSCLKTYFASENEFKSFIETITNPEDKKKFIWLSAFWNVMGDDYPGVYRQSIQLIVIFSIIERLYENEPFVDFYSWLSSKKVEEEQKKSYENTGNIIHKLKEQYRKEHGASEKFRKFSRACLNDEDQNLLASCFTITTPSKKERKTKSIDEVSNIFIDLRNRFIHSASIIDVFLSTESQVFASLFMTIDNKVVTTNITFEEIINLFKKGFISYFRRYCISNFSI